MMATLAFNELISKISSSNIFTEYYLVLLILILLAVKIYSGPFSNLICLFIKKNKCLQNIIGTKSDKHMIPTQTCYRKLIKL